MKTALVGVVAIAALLAALIPCVQFFRSKAGAPTRVEAASPIEEFSVGQGPRPVLVPVTLNGKTILFFVDTGAWKTAFDVSLQAELGQAMGKATVATPVGICEVELFGCPQASVGSTGLNDLESVVCYDLAPIRCASGKEIYGVLGMDFLRNFAVEFDFDHGKFRLWKRAPMDWRDAGEALRISYDESNRPCIDAHLSGSEPERFLVDTGANVSTLCETRFDELCENGQLSASTSNSVIAINGASRGRIGYLKQLQIGSFSHKQLRVDRSPFTALGLYHLSQYHLRLDFPKSIAYFAKGQRFAIPDPIATGGLSILQLNGEKVICVVEKEGPAAARQIQPGDVILEINGRDARACDMVLLREMLTEKPGASVPMRLRRNGQVFTSSIELQNRLR